MPAISTEPRCQNRCVSSEQDNAVPQESDLAIMKFCINPCNGSNQFTTIVLLGLSPRARAERLLDSEGCILDLAKISEVCTAPVKSLHASHLRHRAGVLCTHKTRRLGNPEAESCRYVSKTPKKAARILSDPDWESRPRDNPPKSPRGTTFASTFLPLTSGRLLKLAP